MSCLELNRPKLAEREAMEHLRDFPDDACGHAILSNALLQQKRPHDAADSAMRAVAAAPDYAPAYYALGWAELDRFDFAAAIAAANQAKRIDPGNPSYFYLCGLAYLRTDQTTEALEEASRGLAIHPEHGGCLYIRLLVQMEGGFRKSAAKTLNTARRLYPNAAFVHVQAGWFAYQAAEYHEAENCFRVALQIDPNDSEAIEGLRCSTEYFAFLCRFVGQRRFATAFPFGLAIFSFAIGGLMVHFNPTAFPTKPSNDSKLRDRPIKMPTITKADEERFAKHGLRIVIEPERPAPTEGFEERTRAGRFRTPVKPKIP